VGRKKNFIFFIDFRWKKPTFAVIPVLLSMGKKIKFSVSLLIEDTLERIQMMNKTEKRERMNAIYFGILFHSPFKILSV
jgi:hypothetical protein